MFIYSQSHILMLYSIVQSDRTSLKPGIRFSRISAILFEQQEIFLHSFTDSTKINRPVYSIRMYWTNFRQPTAHVQQNIFETLKEVRCPHLYASFGTFNAKIGPLFEAEWVFKVCLKIDN